MTEKRDLRVFLDGVPFTQGTGFRLSGRVDLNLYPDLFLLQCRNLPKEGIFQLFSLGLDLWNAEVSVSCPAGTSVSDDVRAILDASGTGIRLLGFPGEDPQPHRGRAYAGKAAEAIAQALSQCSGIRPDDDPTHHASPAAACARGFLTPAGLQVIPKDPLPASLHLTGEDLTDRPVFADGGRKMILSTNVIGFQPGDEMTLSFEGTIAKGLVVSRLVDADSYAGPWKTELLIEVHL